MVHQPVQSNEQSTPLSKAEFRKRQKACARLARPPSVLPSRQVVLVLRHTSVSLNCASNSVNYETKLPLSRLASSRSQQDFWTRSTTAYSRVVHICPRSTSVRYAK